MICIENPHPGEKQESTEMTPMMAEEITVVVGRSYRSPINNTIRNPTIGLEPKDALMSISVDENMPLE